MRIVAQTIKISTFYRFQTKIIDDFLVNLDACVYKSRKFRKREIVIRIGFSLINAQKTMNNKIQNLLEQAERQARISETGESSITFASRAFSDADEAENSFNHLKQKLFHIRSWNAESFLTSFELFDKDGKPSRRESAVVGDFIRLSLAGSGKDDWVKIIEITEEPDEAVISVKPSYNPTENQPDKNATSHFFTNDSTNNFCLGKNRETLIFHVIGLDEKTNTNETENFIETVRNVAVSNIGCYSGIQKSEWKIFCKNFLEIEDKK